MSATCKIYFASGDPLRTADGRDTFTAAEAAGIVQGHPWAWADRADDIIVSTYRTRCGAGQYKPVTGRQMAARLRSR